MLNKSLLALAALLAIAPRYALATETAVCTDVSVPKKAVEAHNGKWIQLTPEQWEFLRGIYAMNPLTPPGLPYGDKAALAKVDGDSGGVFDDHHRFLQAFRSCGANIIAINFFKHGYSHRA